MAKKLQISKKELLEQLKGIQQQSERPAREFEPFQNLINEIFDQKTPTWKLNYASGLLAVFGVPPEHRKLFDPLVEEITKVLARIGYRENIETYQEHRLMGSTVWEGYATTPYIPLGILEGNLSLEEARIARGLEVYINCLGGFYSIAGCQIVSIILEPLDADGKTVRDPRLLDLEKFEAKIEKGTVVNEAIEVSVLSASKSTDFPFSRNE